MILAKHGAVRRQLEPPQPSIGTIIIDTALAGGGVRDTGVCPERREVEELPHATGAQA